MSDRCFPRPSVRSGVVNRLFSLPLENILDIKAGHHFPVPTRVFIKFFTFSPSDFFCFGSFREAQKFLFLRVDCTRVVCELSGFLDFGLSSNLKRRVLSSLISVPPSVTTSPLRALIGFRISRFRTYPLQPLLSSRST